MLIIIIGQYSRVLNEETETEIVSFIKHQIKFGKWAPETKIQAVMNGKVIDRGEIQDFFELY